MKLSFKTRTKIIADAKLYVFSRPVSWIIFLLSSFLVMGFIIWSLNLDLLKYILFDAPLSLWGKIEFFIDGYSSLLSSFESIQAIAIVIFSLAFGVNISFLSFTIYHLNYRQKKAGKRSKNKEKLPKKSGAVALGSAVAGGGCIACGTSLLAPIFTSLGITSIGLVRNIGTLFLILGTVFTCYSIYKLSVIVINIKAQETK